MLSLKSYEKSYGGNIVLKVDDLSIEKGIYWLKGANGTGKSTLIKSVAGLLSFKGSISINNIDLKKNRIAYRQKINFADAEPVFPEFLSGEEMIQLFIDAKNGQRSDIAEFIDSMNMNHYLQNSINTYSSGMLKKLSLALALIGKPEWILFDEPFITLDNDSLIVIQSQIKRLCEGRKIGILFSSHQVVNLENLYDVKEMFIEDQSLKVQCL